MLAPNNTAVFGGKTGFCWTSSNLLGQVLAESEGFEPPSPCGLAVFKTAAFDRSANSPGTIIGSGASVPGALATAVRGVRRRFWGAARRGFQEKPYCLCEHRQRHFFFLGQPLLQAFGRNVERIAEGVFAAAELDGAAQCLAGDL